MKHLLSTLFLVSVMMLMLVGCNKSKQAVNNIDELNDSSALKSNIETVVWNLGGESFNIPVGIKTSNERFPFAIGGPQKIHLQSDEGYFIEIEEGVGRYSLNSSSSAKDFGTNRVKSTEITIAGKSFYKRPLYLYKNGDYVDIFSNDFGSMKLSSQGYAINMETGGVIDKNPRYLTEYIFDFGNNIFAITFEDKISNHEDLIKIFLGLDELTTTGESVQKNTDENKKTVFKEDSGDAISKETLQNIKTLNENLVSVKNTYANVYSSILLGRPTVYVIFNSNNTKTNMQAFIKIIDETAEKLVREYQDYVYYAFDYDNQMVLAYTVEPSEQVFNVEGYHFYVNGKSSDANVDCPYRRAYANIVKEKRGVNTLTEWDYYMFRNKLPIDEKGDGSIIGGEVIIGTSAIMEVVKTNWDLILDDKRKFEEFIKIFEEREEIQEIIKEYSVGIVWFNDAGQRILAEVITKNSGNLEIDRRWYNGYKMPK
jgi:hypothetical protein